jgi:hypothetical protein
LKGRPPDLQSPRDAPTSQPGYAPKSAGALPGLEAISHSYPSRCSPVR